MFENFKYEIRRHNSEKGEPQSLPPEVIAKLKSQGLDPETVTMKQLFPETLDEGGNDLSLMSGAEWEIMITYRKTRKYPLENYPQSQEEASGKISALIHASKDALDNRFHVLSRENVSNFTLYGL